MSKPRSDGADIAPDVGRGAAWPYQLLPQPDTCSWFAEACPGAVDTAAAASATTRSTRKAP